MIGIEQQFQVMQMELARLRAQVDRLVGPFGQIVLARDTGAGKWQEQSVQPDGTLADTTDGRKCTSTDPAAKEKAIDGPDFTLLETAIGGDFRYVKIGGGGGGSAKLVKVVGTISGAIGYYQGRLQTAGAALAGSANLADGQLGTFAEADDSNKVLLVNLADLYAGTGHSISPSSNPKIFLAWPVSGMTSTNAWSSTVYFTEAYQPGAVCSA